MLLVFCFDLLDGDVVLFDVVIGQPVPNLEPGVAQVALVWPIVRMCCLRNTR